VIERSQGCIRVRRLERCGIAVLAVGRSPSSPVNASSHEEPAPAHVGAVHFRNDIYGRDAILAAPE
jgi:murein L,D-transpeptidase YcbB/YkuD